MDYLSDKPDTLRKKLQREELYKMRKVLKVFVLWGMQLNRNKDKQIFVYNTGILKMI